MHTKFCLTFGFNGVHYCTSLSRHWYFNILLDYLGPRLGMYLKTGPGENKLKYESLKLQVNEYTVNTMPIALPLLPNSCILFSKTLDLMQ